MQSNVLTLLSDFGTRDYYVGAMKGTIAQINSALTVIDITHDIPAQNIAHARFVLSSAFACFPQGTVHVAVVDPGVGTHRRAIALAVGERADQPDGFLVGPDNGIFSGILDQVPFIKAIELNNPQYWRSLQVSHTFHGRDIFAPVGAHLASGVEISKLGTEIALETLISLNVPAPTYEAQVIRGCIQTVDHFGNLITNIPQSAVAGSSWEVEIRERHLLGLTTYEGVAPGMAVALIGSHGYVEIAVNCGNAQQQLGCQSGETVVVHLD